MKESTLSIIAFILLVTVFSIVALTASLTENPSNNQVCNVSDGSDESKPCNRSIQNQGNYLTNNTEESGHQNNFISTHLSRPGNEPNEPDDTNGDKRAKQPIVDYNDGKDPDSEPEKDDYQYTDDVVE